MSTKNCPSCSAELPIQADTCKECFHNFNETKIPRSGGPIALLIGLAVIAIAGAGVFNWVSSQPVDAVNTVDQKTRSVIFMTQYRDKMETKRIKWDDISRIEHITASNGTFEIVAVSNNGDRDVIQEDPKHSLASRAQVYASKMEKPLVMIDNTTGFGVKKATTPQ